MLIIMRLWNWNYKRKLCREDINL